ncbi:RbtT/DalT/CsbX family MFS transporter [Salinisphaera sp. T31B1]|uniref:RbtT/DalT/CsbX family MFS transporter n=1 Tax=Salinisphaera sp. T31B1 TaxID=727963 RepID=UPI003342DEEE
MFALLSRAGIPPKLAPGYLGVIVFMIGDGLEVAWLQDYFVTHGLTQPQAASIFAGYGLVVAFAAWLSGVLTEALGPKVTMSAGAALFIIGSLLFIPALNAGASYPVLLCSYAIRGFGYPLFSYSFLVVVARSTDKAALGKAVGWFWFCWAGGFSFLGTWYSDIAFSGLHLSPIELLWTGPVFTLAGAAIALYTILNARKDMAVGEGGRRGVEMAALLKGITLPFENYKIGFGGLVRIINTVSVFGFLAFMPTFMVEQDFTRSAWLQIWAAHAFSNILANLVAGAIGDRIGWQRTIIWGGGFLCALCVLGFYYIPVWTGSYWLMMLLSVAYGIALAGYVPLSALVPTLEPRHAGAALAVLNLAAGLAVFVGPAIVGLLIEPLGPEGVVWAFAGLYLVSMVLTRFMSLDETRNEQRHVPAV